MAEKGRLTDGTTYSVPRMGDFLLRVLAFTNAPLGRCRRGTLMGPVGHNECFRHLAVQSAIVERTTITMVEIQGSIDN